MLDKHFCSSIYGITTLGTRTLRMRTLSITTLSIRILSIMPFSIRTLSIMAFSMTINDILSITTLIIKLEYCFPVVVYAECHYAECCGDRAQELHSDRLLQAFDFVSTSKT